MSYTNLFYHVVFSTKERVPLFNGDALGRTCQYIGGVARDLDCQVLLANGAADHLHLLATIHPAVSLANFVKEIKIASHKWIDATFPGTRGFEWQEGYAAFTISKSIVPKVMEYIRKQESHHHRMTFQEELVALLKRHGVEYDERYL